MAITPLGYNLWWPGIIDPRNVGSALSISDSGAMNASGDRHAFIFRCPKSGTLDTVEFRTGNVANNPDNGIRVSLQDINLATGFPDGVVDQFRDITGAIASDTWQVPGLITSDGTNGGVKRTVTKGELLALVIDFVSFVAGDSLTLAGWLTDTGFGGTLATYFADGSTGSYTKTTALTPIFVLKYDDGSYALPEVGGGYSNWPVSSVSNTSYNTGSTPDEYAIRFQLPIACRVVGLWARVDPNADFELILYNGTTAERTIAFDGDTLKNQGPGIVAGLFSSDYEVASATTFRIGIKPTTVTSIQIFRTTFASASIIGALPGGSSWYESTRVDAGAWSDATTNRPIGGLIIDGVDSGGGGASGGGSFAFVG